MESAIAMRALGAGPLRARGQSHVVRRMHYLGVMAMNGGGRGATECPHELERATDIRNISLRM